MAAIVHHHHYEAGTHVEHHNIDADLASAGTQAAAVNEFAEGDAGSPNEQVSSGFQQGNAAQASVRQHMVAKMAGQLIGRQKGELTKETAVRVATDIIDEILIESADNTELAALASHIALGYVQHGQGHYKMTTIARLAVEAANLIA